MLKSRAEDERTLHRSNSPADPYTRNRSRPFGDLFFLDTRLSSKKPSGLAVSTPFKHQVAEATRTRRHLDGPFLETARHGVGAFWWLDDTTLQGVGFAESVSSFWVLLAGEGGGEEGGGGGVAKQRLVKSRPISLAPPSPPPPTTKCLDKAQ